MGSFAEFIGGLRVVLSVVATGLVWQQMAGWRRLPVWSVVATLGLAAGLSRMFVPSMDRAFAMASFLVLLAGLLSFSAVALPGEGFRWHRAARWVVGAVLLFAMVRTDLPLPILLPLAILFGGCAGWFAFATVEIWLYRFEWPEGSPHLRRPLSLLFLSQSFKFAFTWVGKFIVSGGWIDTITAATTTLALGYLVVVLVRSGMRLEPLPRHHTEGLFTFDDELEEPVALNQKAVR